MEREISYIGYQEMIADISTALAKTGEVMEQLELTDQVRQAEEASQRLKTHVFAVGIMGEFKRGKSTVINALLGEEVAPSDPVPATATLNRITYGLTPRATILYKDGRQEVVPVNRIKDYITKITEESEATSQGVEEALVEYPCQFCQNNVEIIDTPGLNDDERMEAITESVIPELDAVVLVLSADSPFSMSEAEFVRNKLMTSDISRMIVLVNRIDAIHGEDARERLLATIKAKIQKGVLDRMASIHGTDSELYRDTQAKLAEIKLYPTSAYQALVGRINGKPELVQKSGILEFEDRLRRLLTQERGSLEILRASTILSKLVQEGHSALELRINALQMDSEEFVRNKQQAEAELNAMRTRRKSETEQLRTKGKDIKEEMKRLVKAKYADLENRLGNYVDGYSFDVKKLNSDEYAAKVSLDIQKEMERALSDYAEQINVFLQQQLGDERLRLSKYVGDLSEGILKINNNMHASNVAITAGTVGVDALSNLVAVVFTNTLSGAGFGLMGLGGMIEGYRQNGFKGAAVGAAGGFIASNLAAYAVVALTGGVAFIPFALITGLAGTMGGKLLSSVIWRRDHDEKRIREFRDGLKAEMVKTVSALREQDLLENWAQNQVETQVNGLIDQFERETESLLAGTEKTLKSIAAELASEEKKKDQQLALYRQLQNTLENVSKSLIPILEMASGSVQPSE